MTRLWLLTALLPPALAHSQVTGSFAIEKSAFAPGEPVVLSFTMQNRGKTTQEVHTADPYSFCSDYTIHLSRDDDPQASCFQGFGGSCMSGAISLAPRASHTERILLNYHNTSRGDLRPPVRLPGDYTVDATRDLAFAPPGPGSPIFSSPSHQEVHQIFHLRVDDALTLPPSTYTAYVEQLRSPDDGIRREAALTLATLAPPALEPLLLTFATSKDYVLTQFAPLALANLATKASLSALAGMLVTTTPGTYESAMAAQYLGETHDPTWLPVLLEFADQHGAWLLSHAAESGGDAAIPALLARMHSPDPNTQSAAIDALGHTGSRAAVPVLIRMLPPGPLPTAGARPHPRPLRQHRAPATHPPLPGA